MTHWLPSHTHATSRKSHCSNGFAQNLKNNHAEKMTGTFSRLVQPHLSWSLVCSWSLAEAQVPFERDNIDWNPSSLLNVASEDLLSNP